MQRRASLSGGARRYCESGNLFLSPVLDTSGGLVRRCQLASDRYLVCIGWAELNLAVLAA